MDRRTAAAAAALAALAPKAPVPAAPIVAAPAPAIPLAAPFTSYSSIGVPAAIPAPIAAAPVAAIGRVSYTVNTPTHQIYATF